MHGVMCEKALGIPKISSSLCAWDNTTGTGFCIYIKYKYSIYSYSL